MTASLAPNPAVQEKPEGNYFVAAELAAKGWLTFSAENFRLTRQGFLRVARLLPRFYHSTLQQVRYT